MEKKLALSPAELDLLLASLSDDDTFCADLKMVIKQNYTAFEERIKTFEKMDAVIENLLIKTWPQEMILKYIQNIIPNEKTRKELLPTADKKIVWTLLEKSAPSAEESLLILKREDGFEFLPVLLQRNADFNEACEKIIFKKAAPDNIETYCLKCRKIHNIELLLSDPGLHRFLIFYIQNNPFYGSLPDRDVSKIIPFPEMLELYVKKHTVPFSEVKKDKNFEKYINRISVATHDWLYGGMTEEMLATFLKSALSNGQQKASLKMAIERYGNQLSLTIAQTLTKIEQPADEEVIECLLENSDKKIFELIPKKQYISAALRNQKVKKRILQMKNAEITSMLISEDPLGYEFENFLLEYPETERRKLIMQHGRKYGFARPELNELHCKYEKDAFWQKIKSFFKL